jgi:hypothetical protein
MSFEQWLPEQIKAEREIKTIQLSAEGTIWETWSAPFTDPEAFVQGCKAVISVNAAESRKGRVGLLFTAIGAAGQIKSQCASSCMGTNAQADALVGSGGGSAKAFSDAMMGQASLMNTLLKAAENMVTYQARVNESLTQQIVDLTAYKQATMQAELEAKESASEVPDFIMTQVKELAPQAAAAFQLWIESQQSKSPAAKAPKNGNAALKNKNRAKK